MRTCHTVFALALLLIPGLSAQTQHFYTGSDATGKLVRTATTNVGAAASSFRALAFSRSLKKHRTEFNKKVLEPLPRTLMTFRMARMAPAPISHSLTLSPASASLNFLGLTHYEQRNANNGQQFSVEPPSPEVAVANGYVLHGVNNAIQVYDTAGKALLPKTLSTNELFGVSPAITDQDVYGVYPTDMRVFYDHEIDRWFVVQRAQDYDTLGNPLSTSHLYMAVSQTGDPTGTYNIYTIETTNATHPGCPCFADFPQIGADKYGIYISTDEYNSSTPIFAGVWILAISKSALASGALEPTMAEFVVPRVTGYEATVRPAITPPGASYALVSGGVQYFVSTLSNFSSDSSFGLWAMTNTASLNTAPALTLIQTVVPGLPYTFPDVATQRSGPLPFGSTLTPPGLLAFLDGGRDSRVLSLVYAGGRLLVTFETAARDSSGLQVIAGGYAVLFPSYRSGILKASLSHSGYLLLERHNVLRPAAAVTAKGRGGISFTLSGPDHFPAAAFLPLDNFKVGSAIQIAAPGVAPQDGFTGYPDLGFATTGIARWGDYSSAFVAPDGSIWMAAEYIPDAPRTEFANWGVRVFRRNP
jgi:hypothetical protein